MLIPFECEVEEEAFSRMMLPLRARISVVPLGYWVAVTLRAMVQEFAGVKGSLVNASCLALQVLFWIFMAVAWKRILLIIPPDFLYLGAASWPCPEVFVGAV